VRRKQRQKDETLSEKQKKLKAKRLGDVPHKHNVSGLIPGTEKKERNPSESKLLVGWKRFLAVK
jgi:hypothetical protein